MTQPTPVQKIKELLNLDSFEGYAGLVDPIRQLVKERDEALQLRTQLVEIKQKLGLGEDCVMTEVHDKVSRLRASLGDLTKLSTDLRTQRDALYERLTQVVDVTGEPTLEELVERLVAERDQALQRATIVTEYDDGMREAMQRIAVACGKKFAVDIGYDNLPEVVESLLSERNKAVTTLKLAGYTDNGAELWKPPLGETPERFKPRYIVHGDIQPCVVLYSDETTTLVRLDENDMMCETSTIEWSDELTYRCQEMLRQTAPVNAHLMNYAKALAELVANEELLINDNGADPAYFRNENAIQTPVDGTNWDSGSSPTQQR